MNPTQILSFLALVAFCMKAFSVQAEPSSTPEMLEKFKTPPFEARPKTWLHSMSSNMNKEGFTKDLEAIAEAGMSGVLLFNVTHTIPKGTVLFNSDEHHEILKHAAKESERLGLTFGLHNSDGWTSSGGPWMTAEHSMKMINWSEKVVSGGEIDILLPQPTARENYFRDVAVIAYPSSKQEIIDSQTKPKFTASHQDIDLSILADQRWDKETILKASKDKNGWITIEFPEPKYVNSVFMSLHKTIAGSRTYRLYSSNDGENFTLIEQANLQRLGKREFAINHNIGNVKAKFFKIETEDDYRISEIQLSSRAHYDGLLTRTSLFMLDDHKIKPLKNNEFITTVNQENIIDLTQAMDASGRLQTKLPKGHWTILRFAYTSTSAKNSPASDEGRGLEADKMDKQAVSIHYNSYPGRVHKNVRDVAPNSLQYVEIDSFEVGGQNWTHNYEKKFEEKNNYSLIKFLPLYAGRLVNDVESSRAVLGDIRRFNSHLITENYFAHFTELAHAEGLISYFEPYSFNAPFNEIDAGRHADIPMGEFWMRGSYQAGTAVSSAHLYGKKIVSAEAFSAKFDFNWKTHPGTMKNIGDNAWARGINEFMFHRYAHQANVHVKPGMTMAYWGSHIDRTQTWWKDAAPAWFNYIARGSYLLRQGNPVSDLLIFMGDGAPNSVTKRNNFKPAIPSQINYINTNKHALLNRIQPKNGQLVLPEGTRFKALALFNSKEMSLEVAQKLQQLADNQIIIIGKKPLRLTGYGNSKIKQDIFNKLIDDIWSKPTTYSHNRWDEIFAKQNIDFDLNIEKTQKFVYAHRETKHSDIYFMVNNEDSARVFNTTFLIEKGEPQKWDPVTGEVTHLARVTHREDKTIAPIFLEKNGAAFIVFEKTKNKSAYNKIEEVVTYHQGKRLPSSTIQPVLNKKTNSVVFDMPAQTEVELKFPNDNYKKINEIKLPKNIDLNEWSISFDKEFGYGKKLKNRKLFDWSQAKPFNLKHYSGTANYETLFSLSKKYLQDDNRIVLDLGEVRVIAAVTINGEKVRTLWTHPYKVDITNYLKIGSNTLEISVSNTWVNRLIGDEHFPRTDGFPSQDALGKKKMPKWYTDNKPPPKGERLTFTTFDFYEKTDPLVSSGLIGPVTLKPLRRVVVDL